MPRAKGRKVKQQRGKCISFVLEMATQKVPQERLAILRLSAFEAKVRRNMAGLAAHPRSPERRGRLVSCPASRQVRWRNRLETSDAGVLRCLVQTASERAFVLSRSKCVGLI
ncbi:hypothetical protein PUN4_780061 [Paraburkholderia unamae]|nr:hypothetical protein PUN4_780061 [Paraburkholderia unamae]